MTLREACFKGALLGILAGTIAAYTLAYYLGWLS